VSVSDSERRAGFAHDAVVVPPPDEDERAPGAAITIELCGSTDHEPPCPFAPHFTDARRVGEELHLRVLFSVVPERETEVRERIVSALRAQWEVRSAGATPLRPDEVDHAQRLAAS
jgi:hypothetical protein